ncbi:hypothetical protein ACFS7Z_14755 [Pontibacter toksunensis]|uniref:Nucleotide-diphospho-sugar transferase n=1 Tax=Pontibacter toksunensis TaxID=1332631 RepID=A0ABW6BXE9_9BACT
MKNIILLSYEREADYRMAVFAVLSFWAWFSGKKSDVRIFIFTDNPGFFYPLLSDFPIEYEYLSASKLESMLGGMDYIHRRKIAVVDEVFQRFPSDDLVFLDSDIFFMSDALPWLESFAPGKSYMHLAEHTFEGAVRHNASFNHEHYPIALIKLIESKTFTVRKKVKSFHKKQVYWNSGVLGLTKESAPLLPDVFTLNDEFYSATRWHISEQLAFSLVLQTATQILPCDQYILHYWGQRQKKFIDKILLSVYNDGFTCLDLENKLATVKKLSLRFPKLIQADKLKERSIDAFSRNCFLSGCKNALYGLAKTPFDFNFLRELVSVAQQKFMRGGNNKEAEAMHDFFSSTEEAYQSQEEHIDSDSAHRKAK